MRWPRQCLNLQFVWRGSSVASRHWKAPLSIDWYYGATRVSGCYLYLGAEQRAFGIGFWQRGVHYGDIVTPSVGHTASLVELWAEKECDIGTLRAHAPRLRLSPLAEAFERGDEVDAKWRLMLESPHWLGVEVDNAVKAAYRPPESPATATSFLRRHASCKR